MVNVRNAERQSPASGHKYLEFQFKISEFEGSGSGTFKTKRSTNTRFVDRSSCWVRTELLCRTGTTGRLCRTCSTSWRWCSWRNVRALVKDCHPFIVTVHPDCG